MTNCLESRFKTVILLYAVIYYNKRYRRFRKKSRMNNPETLETCCVDVGVNNDTNTTVSHTIQTLQCHI